jgi:peptide/nickel transport system permease protein
MSEENNNEDILHSLPFLDYRTTPIYQPPSYFVSILIFLGILFFWLIKVNTVLFSTLIIIEGIEINIIIDIVVLLIFFGLVYAISLKRYKLLIFMIIVLYFYTVLGLPDSVNIASVPIIEFNVAFDLLTLIQVIGIALSLIFRKLKFALFLLALVIMYTILGTLGIYPLVVNFDTPNFEIPLLFLQVAEQFQLLRIQMFVFIGVIIVFAFILPNIHVLISKIADLMEKFQIVPKIVPSIRQLGSIFKFLFGFLKSKTLAFGIAIVFLFLFIAIFAQDIAPYGFDERHTDCGDNRICRQAPPSPEHLMGTNTIGWDLYSRVIYGAQIPFLMSIFAATLAFFIGIPIGLISGYYGGFADRIINAFMDLVYSFPSILFAITLSLFLSSVPFIGSEEDITPKIIIVVGFSVGLVYIPVFYKIVRSQVFQIKELPYIEAVRSIGASNRTIQTKYVLPNVIANPISLIPFPMVDAILTGAALAFLGIGLQAPTPDWGYDLTEGSRLITISPWWVTYPGLMVFLLAFAFALIGDALNDSYNPMLQSIEAYQKADETEEIRKHEATKTDTYGAVK